MSKRPEWVVCKKKEKTQMTFKIALNFKQEETMTYPYDRQKLKIL